MGRIKLTGCQMGCDLPCIREGCPYWGGIELVCDCCGVEVGELFTYDGEELCEDCLEEKARHISDVCEECGSKLETELVEYEGKNICFDCFTMKVIGKKIPFHRFWCDECNEDWTNELWFDESGTPMCKSCFKEQHKLKD